LIGLDLDEAIKILKEKNIIVNSIEYIYPPKKNTDFTRKVVVRAVLRDSKVNILVAYFKP